MEEIMRARIPLYTFIFIALGLMTMSCQTTRHQVARSHINQLKESTILVRLNTYLDRYNYFMDNGQEAAAKDLKKQLEFHHKEMIRAFNVEFDFCEVYYFYAQDAKQVRSGELSGILRDTNLQVISSSQLSSIQQYYVVGLDDAVLDTEYNPVKGKLVVMEPSFEALESPFPFYHGYYYTRLPHQSLSLRKKRELRDKNTRERKMVYMLNRCLYQYYDKQQ